MKHTCAPILQSHKPPPHTVYKLYTILRQQQLVWHPPLEHDVNTAFLAYITLRDFLQRASSALQCNRSATPCHEPLSSDWQESRVILKQLSLPVDK
jgi:hypothetical protein